jgi:hypothetical protein
MSEDGAKRAIALEDERATRRRRPPGPGQGRKVPIGAGSDAADAAALLARKVGGRKKRLREAAGMAPEVRAPLDPLASLPFDVDPELRALLRTKRAYRDRTGREVVVGSGGTAKLVAGDGGALLMDMKQVYRQCHRLVAQASPHMLTRLIDLAMHSEDDRVSSVCAIAILDRYGMRPRDVPERDQASRPAFNPRNYNPDDLTVIELALRLMLKGKSEEVEPEVLPPG